MSYRTCDRCTASTAARRRCKLTTCKYGPKCWIHTKKDDGLQVKPSTIPNAGDGLFATRLIPKHTMFAYSGKRVAENRLNGMGRGAGRGWGRQFLPYSISVGRGRQRIVYDACRTNDNVARYVNDPRGTNLPTNASLVERNRKPYLQIDRDIQPGEEILTSYGADYWRIHDDPTKRMSVGQQLQHKAFCTSRS